MATIKHGCFITGQTRIELISQDMKVNIINSHNAIGVQVSKSLCKEGLTEILASVLDE